MGSLLYIGITSFSLSYIPILSILLLLLFLAILFLSLVSDFELVWILRKGNPTFLGVGSLPFGIKPQWLRFSLSTFQEHNQHPLRIRFYYLVQFRTLTHFESYRSNTHHLGLPKMPLWLPQKLQMRV